MLNDEEYMKIASEYFNEPDERHFLFAKDIWNAKAVPSAEPVAPTTYNPDENELSNYQIRFIHSGLLMPNEQSIHKMAREIRKWRGEENPDAV